MKNQISRPMYLHIALGKCVEDSKLNKTYAFNDNFDGIRAIVYLSQHAISSTITYTEIVISSL